MWIFQPSLQYRIYLHVLLHHPPIQLQILLLQQPKIFSEYNLDYEGRVRYLQHGCCLTFNEAQTYQRIAFLVELR
ncbi:hypothetical protein OXYTRIMIC_322 [Oxytricha trifallax]|uniref:Uncharacterized protein n=1 Tax=Oxytricha trifallax TaxID=1172189 RepID=A0A073HZP6_9SPIT|nr:hypothetical protein OXYTRIMIC_322 [Oxytricha trifallax]